MTGDLAPGLDAVTLFPHRDPAPDFGLVFTPCFRRVMQDFAGPEAVLWAKLPRKCMILQDIFYDLGFRRSFIPTRVPVAGRKSTGEDTDGRTERIR